VVVKRGAEEARAWRGLSTRTPRGGNGSAAKWRKLTDWSLLALTGEVWGGTRGQIFMVTCHFYTGLKPNGPSLNITAASRRVHN